MGFHNTSHQLRRLPRFHEFDMRGVYNSFALHIVHSSSSLLASSIGIISHRRTSGGGGIEGRMRGIKGRCRERGEGGDNV